MNPRTQAENEMKRAGKYLRVKERKLPRPRLSWPSGSIRG